MVAIDRRHLGSAHKRCKSRAPFAAVTDEADVHERALLSCIGQPLGCECHPLEVLGEDALIAQSQMVKQWRNVGLAVHQRLRCFAVVNALAMVHARVRVVS